MLTWTYIIVLDI